jgi:hypothetical protein
MKYTPEQEISETNETDVYKPMRSCSICPIAVRCHLKAYPPCNMRMLVLREMAADGMISDFSLQRYEAEYRGE